jgi:hypothetical protein
MNMELEGLNEKQMEIADLLWVCHSQQEVAAVINRYGVDAVVVRDLMLAAHFDRCQDTTVAKQELDRIFN